jgi:pilus assembly protein Flp/PilA
MKYRFFKPRLNELRRINMKTYLRKIMAFINDEEGASAIEYALLVAMVALGVATAAVTLGPKVVKVFTDMDAAMPK